jgi:arylsulfatase
LYATFLTRKRFRWEGSAAPGKQTVVFDFYYDGPGFGKGDRFTGKLDKLTVKLILLNAAEEELLKEKEQDTRNKAQ